MSLGIAVGLIWLSPFRTTRAVWIPVSGDKSRMCRVGHPSCCANAISPQQQRLPRSIMRSCRSRMTLFGMEKRISKLAFRMLPCLHYRIRRRCTTSRKSPIPIRGRAALQHVQQREHLAIWIAQNECSYLKALLSLFPAAEERGDYTASLGHWLLASKRSCF